jgi:tetratricopeptide (TPR) repeat protein
LGVGEGRLVCTAGPIAGRKFELTGDEVEIGRAVKSAIAIPDPTVSRRHLLLRRSASGWTAQDLGSGNGSVLNGKRILEETLLSEGDLLALGDTQFSFHSFDQGSLVSRSKRPVLLWRAAGLACLGTAVVLAWTKQNSARLSAERIDEARRSREELEAAFQSAKKLVRQGDWAEALAAFERIRAQAPQLPGLREYIERGKTELPNQRLIAGARAALGRNELAIAAEALAKVIADTQLHAQLQAAKELLRERVAARIAEGRRAFEERDYPRVLEIVEDVLKAVPDNADAQSLAGDARRSLAIRRKPLPQPAFAALRETSASRFRQGDLKGAIEAAEDCVAKKMDECRRLLSELREFADLQGRVEQLDLKDLERLLALDLRIAGGTSSGQVKSGIARAAAMYYNEASKAKAAAHWARAMELAARTLQLAPDHPGALSVVSEIKLRAKELFVFAYSVKDTAPDEAISRFKEVIALTPADDETHRKAVNWVEKLSR